MRQTLRWTSADLALLPDDGKRYEIIEGDLYVSRQPQTGHQLACGEIFAALNGWNDATGAGSVIFAPGLILDEEDDVVPDVVWISSQRLAFALEKDGHLHAAPELVVEVLSPGSTNVRRDREIKLKLYARHPVSEYWIVDWRSRTVDVFRRDGPILQLHETASVTDILESPVLPGFHYSVADFFRRIPTG